MDVCITHNPPIPLPPKIYLDNEAIWNISSGHPSEKLSVLKVRTGNTEAEPNITDPLI